MPSAASRHRTGARQGVSGDGREEKELVDGVRCAYGKKRSVLRGINVGNARATQPQLELGTSDLQGRKSW